MPCRVGITTNPSRRREEWKKEHPNLKDWEIIAVYQSKKKAQERENREASSRGCQSSPGGAGDERDTWYVYYFRY